MASTQKNFRKLTRLGAHSYYVTIPPSLVRELGWRQHQKLIVKKRGKSIVITDWEKK